MEKISKEVAGQEFQRVVDAWDIDEVDVDDDEDEKKGFKAIKKLIVKHIQRGTATVDDEGDILFTPQYSSDGVGELHFSVPRGAAFAMGNYKANHEVKKLCSYMGDMTKKPPATFANMDGRDFKFCSAVVGLFLG